MLSLDDRNLKSHQLEILWNKFTVLIYLQFWSYFHYVSEFLLNTCSDPASRLIVQELNTSTNLQNCQQIVPVPVKYLLAGNLLAGGDIFSFCRSKCNNEKVIQPNWFCIYTFSGPNGHLGGGGVQTKLFCLFYIYLGKFRVEVVTYSIHIHRRQNKLLTIPGPSPPLPRRAFTLLYIPPVYWPLINRSVFGKKFWHPTSTLCVTDFLLSEYWLYLYLLWLDKFIEKRKCVK